MNGMRFLDQAKRVLKTALEHWVWLFVGILILGGLISWIGWKPAGVIAQFLVALIALGGYVLADEQYREQEKRKYTAAVVATFPVPSQEKREGERACGWIPGFVRRMDESDEVLDVDFCLENISESPVTDVHMNFYLHDYEHLNEPPEKPTAFFENDIPLADGIAKGARAPFARTLRPHFIRELDNPVARQLSGGGKVRAFDFMRLFLSLIPSERREEPAQWSAWSLVLKYKNLQGESFFSAYKLEGPVVPLGSLRPEEYFRMAFYGSYSGDYCEDDGNHQFVANRGFPSKTKAPRWERIEVLRLERATMAAVAPTPSNLPPPS